MTSTNSELSTRWDAAKTKQKLAEILDQDIDLSVILEQFSPDHVHDPWMNLTWGVRLVHSIVNHISGGNSELPDKVLQMMLTFYGVNANKTKSRLVSRLYNESYRHEDQLVVKNLVGAVFPLSNEQLLGFQMVDFESDYQHRSYSLGFIAIDTTKVEGNIFRVVDIKGAHYPSAEGIIGERGQKLISAMFNARVK